MACHNSAPNICPAPAADWFRFTPHALVDMAIFDRLFRAKPSSTHMPPDAPLESVDAMRRRARQRLVGSSVLVAIGVSLFAVMFDRQPRPVSIDIPIDIPDKRTAKPLDLPSLPAGLPALSPTPPTSPASTPATSIAPAAAVVAATTAVAAVAAAQSTHPTKSNAATVAVDKSLSPGEKVVQTSKPTAPTPTPEPKPEPARVDTPTPVPTPVPAVAKEAPSADAVRAKALLEGASPQAAKDKSAIAQSPAGAESARFIVQFGSFGEAARAQETRKTVERAGLKTYAQEAATPDGKRIRVRVGPFATRSEAEKAAAKIKSLGLPASILTL